MDQIAIENNKLPILALTALEGSWGDFENLIFLGEWCKKYERRHILDGITHQTLRFHWDDRKKLSQDYIYLENLHKLLLDALAEALNNLHGVNQTRRYWQILLDPWLFSYISVIFDRWECLRHAFGRHTKVKVIFFESTKIDPPYSYEDFSELAAFSDEWNQLIYQKIIEYRYIPNCSRITLIDKLATPKFLHQKTFKTKLREFFYRLLNLSFGNFLIKNKVIVIGASFRFISLISIFFRLGQFPSIDPLIEYRFTRKSSKSFVDTKDRAKILTMGLNFNCGSDFEFFLKDSLINDLPCCLVEDFHFLREKVSHVELRPKVIMTGSSHWNDFFAKMWFAEHISRAGKLIILEHGGSLPTYKELFNFEVDISDSKISWFLPHPPKHIQMPPPKLLTIFPKVARDFFNAMKVRRYCTLIGNENPRWVLRAHFYPMSNQWSTSFEMTKVLYNSLDDEIKASFRVKPYLKNQGWNTLQRFSDLFGFNKLLLSKSLTRAFNKSKIIICSYPETTFSEAMTSGVPVILVYPEKFYELNEVALALVEILKSARIIFHCPEQAAIHINSIWNDPSVWWNSPAVNYARSEFYSQAINIESGWMKKWVTFLRSLAVE